MKLGCDFEKVSNYLEDRKDTFRHFEEERQQALDQIHQAVLDQDYRTLWALIENEQYLLRECFAWMWASDALAATCYEDWSEHWMQLGAAKDLVQCHANGSDEDNEEFVQEDFESFYDEAPEEWLDHLLREEVRS